MNGGTPVRPNDAFLVFGAPQINEEDIEEVVASMRSGWLGTGPKVAAFEERFRRYKNTPHAVAVNSCTAALHLSMLAADLKPGDEVITTPLTFASTINAIIHSDATPVLADIDPVTMNISPEAIEARVTTRTRAILPVHFAGRGCDMRALTAVARKHDLKIIEDCAHAVETLIEGQPAGTFGDFGCFSFYVTKNVVTAEGGMVISRQAKDSDRVKILALHGLSHDAWKRFGDEGYKHYYVVECGYKYNMTDLQAAIGIHQMDRVSDNWQRRVAIWERYQRAFADLPIGTPAPVPEGDRHGHHLYTVQIEQNRCGIARDDFLAAMTKENIGVGVHYLSIPEHPYYQTTFGWTPEEWPNATSIGRSTVSLPLSARLTDRDVDDVIHAVTRLLRYYGN